MSASGNTSSPRGGEGRERVVLVVTLAAALALVAVAFSPAIDPERAGGDALRRLSDATVRALREEWQRMLESGELGAPASETFLWRAGFEAPTSEMAPGVTPLAARADDPAGAEGVGLLVALAEEAELGTSGVVDLSSARARVDSALALTGLSRAQRTLLCLRAVQLAARADDAAGVRAAWLRARDELDGSETVDGTSALLLAGLAAAPFLESQERRALRAELSSDWLAGTLALPDEQDVLSRVGASVRVEPSWRLAALRDGLAGIAPEAASYAALDARFAARRTAALERALGGLPAVPAEGRAALVDSGLGPLLVRRAPDGRGQAHFVDLARARAALATRADAAGLVPDGFTLAFTGEAPAQTTRLDGERVGPPLSLWEDKVEVALRHRDPRALVRAETRRAWLLRGALLALGAFVAAAGATTFRALRRERRLHELRTRFVADVSHELRTPLASILLMAENLEDGRVPDESARRRYHGLIRREARRLARLVDDVLDFARLERGERPRVRPEAVELAPFLAGLEGELRARCQAAEVELELRPGELPGRAAFDPEALRRALWNLVDNAVKHGAGPVEVALGARSGELIATVRDHGPGLPSASRERAFRPFERLARESVAGTGLGLAIVREIARAHGGDASARAPESGAGIVFELRLPLDEPAREGETQA